MLRPGGAEAKRKLPLPPSPPPLQPQPVPPPFLAPRHQGRRSPHQRRSREAASSAAEEGVLVP